MNAESQIREVELTLSPRAIYMDACVETGNWTNGAEDRNTRMMLEEKPNVKTQTMAKISLKGLWCVFIGLQSRALVSG